MQSAGRAEIAGAERPTITSRANARVRQLRAALAGQARLSGGMVAIEGEHLLEEAVRSGITPDVLFLTGRRAPPPWLPAGIEVLHLSEKVFAGVADTRSPQGIAALLVPPVWGMDDLLRSGVPLIVVAAGLQDPGNLGTLIRSAEAFGATGVAVTPGTVSAWNGKVTRASAGSVFRVPVVACDRDRIAALRSGGVRVLAAVGRQSGVRGVLPIGEADLTRPVALLLGNEGAGLAAEWMALADAWVTIPCPGPVESLNAAVAGSVMLFEASRQRAEAGARPR